MYLKALIPLAISAEDFHHHVRFRTDKPILFVLLREAIQIPKTLLIRGRSWTTSDERTRKYVTSLVVTRASLLSSLIFQFRRLRQSLTPILNVTIVHLPHSASGPLYDGLFNHFHLHASLSALPSPFSLPLIFPCSYWHPVFHCFLS